MSEEYISQLEALLKQSMVADTKLVKEASQRLSSQFYGSKDSLPAMIHILTSHPETQIKQLAAVEARKLVVKYWGELDDTTKSGIRSSVLSSTLGETERLVAHSSAKVISSITEVEDLSDNKWPELVNTIIQQINSGENSLTRETSIYILYSLLDGYQNLALIEHASDFIDLLGGVLNDSNVNNRVNAFQGLIAIANCIEDPSDDIAGKFKSLFNSMVNLLKDTIQNDDSTNARTVFVGFNDFPYLENKFVGENLFVLINVFVELALTSGLDEEFKTMALQFLIRVVPMKKSKIISKNLGQSLTLAGLKIACEPIDDEEELDENADENENEESTVSSLGLRLLQELANELPPKQAITPIFNELGNLMNSNDIYKVRAGLLAVGVISSGAPDFVSIHLAKLVPFLIQGLKNDSPVVKLAALKSLHELSGQLQNTLAEYHESLLPLLMQVIDTSSHQSIYKFATYALDGILEYMEQEAIVPYLEPLTGKLFTMLNQANSAPLKTAVVSAIGSAAFAAGKSFEPYFTTTLELLEPMIKFPENIDGLTVDEIELIASSFENVSTVARAVGAASFAKVAQPLITSSNSCISSENPRLREAGFSFINNMAKVYGEDFSPFLPDLVPAIIACLQQEELIFNDEDDEEEGEVDLNKLQISTGITMEKEIATIALGELATATKNHFGDYVKDVVAVLLEQTDSFTISNVCVDTLWIIITALYENNVALQTYPVGAVADSYIPDQLLEIVKLVRSKSIELIADEYELNTIHSILTSMETAFKKIGAIAIMDHGESAELETLCVEVMKLLKGEHISQTEDEDKASIDNIEESETEILIYDTCLDVLIALSTVLGNDFNRIFTSFKSVLYKNLSAVSKQKRSVTTGALAEICLGLKEHNQSANELFGHFVELLSKDTYLNVRSDAAYGVGIIVFHSPEDLSSAYPTILASLSKLLDKAEKQQSSDDDETQEVVLRSYANACGCVARLALKNPSAVPLDQIVPVLLDHLPLNSAFEENTPIFNLIIKLYQSNPELIEPHTPTILNIFKGVFKKDEDREKLEKEGTLGREQNIDTLKQFPVEGLKEKVVELIKYLESKK